MRTGRSLTVCCSLLPGGDLPGPGGFSLVLGGGGSPCLGEGVVSAWSRGGGFSGDPPPVDGITDACKNITLAATSLRPVNIWKWLFSEKNSIYLIHTMK